MILRARSAAAADRWVASIASACRPSRWFGGLGIATFFAWRIGGQAREQAFKSGTRFAKLYWSWVWLLRFVAPPAVIAVFLHAVGFI